MNDPASWLLLKRYADERLAEIQSALESDIDPTPTARLRGQAAELRALLNHFEPRH